MQNQNSKTQSLHITILNEEFSRRVEKNSRYSMRAFAKQLGIHPSALSRILSGKQRMSSGSALTVTQKIGLTGDVCRLFLQSVVDEQKKLESAQLGEAVQMPNLKVHPQKITEESYAIIARVMCLALRELMLTDDFISEPDWMARRLGVSIEDVEKSLNTLAEAGLIQKAEGRWVHTDRHLTAVNIKQSSEIRVKLQKEVVQKALQSLDKDPFEQRGHYSMTMAINPERINEANRMIMEFMETLCDYLETGARKEVYQLSVQLFPLTERRGVEQ